MKEIFATDNLFNEILTKIFDIVVLNILWLLCCLPIITIGASTTALYTVTMKMVRNRESGIVKSFFKAFKENFKGTVPATLIMLVTIAILVADFHILGQSTDRLSAVAYGGCLVLLLIWVAIFGYLYPLIAKFENTLKNTFSNAGKLAVINPLKTVAMVVLNVLPVAWLMISPETFAYIFWLWLIAGTGLVAFINSFILNSIFDKLVENADE